MKSSAQIVKLYGGVATNAIRGKLYFLVVCENGNPAWAFAMYRRKVEKAKNAIPESD